MSEFDVKTSTRTYPVYIENGCIAKLPEQIRMHCSSLDSVIITDQNVADIYREKIDNLLRAAGLVSDWIVIRSGETSKNLETYKHIIENLQEYNLPRDGLIIGLGGGVVCDITGFTASTYKRGIRWICVPTTLLAQVDASIGGKTAIHMADVKNLVGSFHQPVSVITDPEFLNTLDDVQFISGSSEALKMALLPGGEHFAIWDKNTHSEFFNRNPKALLSVIDNCCRMKASVVEKDEFDFGGRIILNLGHTIAHAIEAHGLFSTYTHGQAVCIGVLFIAKTSFMNGDITSDDLAKIHKLFEPVIKITPAPDVSWKELIPFMLHDKKNMGADLRIVYLLGIGRIAIRNVSPADLESPWQIFCEKFSKSER
jgi:3-dehydroquinate synthase